VELRPKPDTPNELEPNTVTVMLSGETEQKTVSVLLIDAQTDQILKKLEVAMAISF
jgi:hypothetical protein